MPNTTLVIHHSADFDGIFSREIARKHFGASADYLGWDYGQPLPVIAPEVTRIYMIDISIDGMMDDPRLIWIDHHKSAIEKFAPTIPGYRIDGVAACRLAWQWFMTHNNEPNRNELGAAMPAKKNYVDRDVSEPLAVRLAGEYDIWDKRDPRAELFQHRLRSQELSENLWACLLVTAEPEVNGQRDIGTVAVESLLEYGTALQYAKTHENAGIITSYGFTTKWEGLTFLCCNHARFNSHLFTAGLKPEHEALLGFNYDGAGNWRVSLYHAPGHEGHDLSQIAVKYGGGGHRGACGFKVKSLPFLT